MSEMEKLIPFSKSRYNTWIKCHWRAYAEKVLGLKSKSSKQASNGNEVHDWRVQIQSGSTDMDTALAQASSPVVSELTAKSIANSLYTDIEDEKHEQFYHNEYVHGYVDRVGRLNGKLFVEDLKTGRFESDDPIERDIYSVLVWDAESTPDDEELLFVRFFCRSGNHDEFHYSRHDIEEARQVLIQIADDIRNSEPEPMPGPHCMNWYGRPCEYQGKECPLAADVPALVGSAVPTGLPQIGKAFMSVYQGSPLTPEIASMALQGVQQLEAAAKQVKETLKNYSESNGPIDIGGAKYGMSAVPEYDVDKAFALEAMVEAGLSLDEIAELVSITKTGVEKISQRKYGSLRDTILSLGVTTSVSEKKRFGKIK